MSLNMAKVMADSLRQLAKWHHENATLHEREEFVRVRDRRDESKEHAIPHTSSPQLGSFSPRDLSGHGPIRRLVHLRNDFRPRLIPLKAWSGVCQPLN
jgi:hypothetical protein